MCDDVVGQLNRMLPQPLPQYYLQFLQNYPDDLKYANRALDDSDREGTVSDVELLSSLKCVLTLNREAREDALVRPDGLELLWPDQFAIIGESGAGDYYCIDVKGEIEGVIQYDHQAVQFNVCADSVDEFAEMLVETFIDDEQQD